MSFKKKILALVGLVAIFLLTTGAWRETATITKLWISELRALTGYTLNLYSPVLNTQVTFDDATAQIREHTLVDLSGTSHYTIDKANGSIFWIDTHESHNGTRSTSSGISIILPTITAAYDHYKVRIFNAPGLVTTGGLQGAAASGSTIFSGTTTLCITTAEWSSGLTDHLWGQIFGGATTWQSAAASGATYGIVTADVYFPPETAYIDAPGDWVEYLAMYDAVTGSTWYQVGKYIH